MNLVPPPDACTRKKGGKGGEEKEGTIGMKRESRKRKRRRREERRDGFSFLPFLGGVCVVSLFFSPLFPWPFGKRKTIKSAFLSSCLSRGFWVGRETRFHNCFCSSGLFKWFCCEKAKNIGTFKFATQKAKNCRSLLVGLKKTVG